LSQGAIGGILGPSGCGKTTLIRCIAGFERIAEGEISIDGRLVSSPTTHVPPEERKIGLLFQEHALFPHLSVKENVAFGLSKIPRTNRDERVAEMLAQVRLTEFKNAYPYQLSGGQQQRVALARALAPVPEILLLDEPFSSLDSELKDAMKMELKELLHKLRVTALFITHSKEEVFDLADEMGVIADGNILQWGQPYDLYHHPSCSKVADFLGFASHIEARLEGGTLNSEMGPIPVPANDIHHFVAGKSHRILIRPDDIVHDDESAIKARIDHVAFRGMYWVYHLSLPSGTRLFCYTSSHHPVHEVGTMLGVRWDMKHLVLL
jgi:iron(III) transport system ATP-binding protein